MRPSDVLTLPLLLTILINFGRKSDAYPGCVYMAEPIPNAQIIACEHSGHAPFYEEPEKFNAAVADFVTGSFILPDP